MKRLAVSVEGPTEREFVSKCLGPHLRGVGWDVCQPVLLGNNGGSVSMKRIRDDVRFLAKQFECVTTLFDLYGFQQRGGRDAATLEADMSKEVGAVPCFVPYVQQYEFEALLFSNLQIVNSQLHGSKAALNEVQRVLSACKAPEAINDGFDTCPSKRLLKTYPRYEKYRQGPEIATAIGISTMRAHCPRFDSWVATLESHPLVRQHV